MLFAPNYQTAFFANFVLLGAALAWLGAATAAEIAGAGLRGMAVAIYFFAVNIAAYAVGSPLIGKLNDRAGIITDPQTCATANAELMRYTLLVCHVSRLLAAICLCLGSRNQKAV